MGPSPAEPFSDNARHAALGDGDETVGDPDIEFDERESGEANGEGCGDAGMGFFRFLPAPLRAPPRPCFFGGLATAWSINNRGVQGKIVEKTKTFGNDHLPRLERGIPWGLAMPAHIRSPSKVG